MLKTSLRFPFVRALRLLGVTAFALALVACGGGGASGSSSNAPSKPWGTLVYGQDGWRQTP